MDRLAIVIPVLNDTTALRNLLAVVRAWADQPDEILVVTANVDSEIETLCREYRCRALPSVPCRGRQLDDGARAAAAELLWFLHADAAPQATSLAAIRAARASGAEAGYFRFEFTGRRAFVQRTIEWLVRWRSRLGGIPYGDQGLWSMRTAYLACGGFAHQPLFEEVGLIRQLRRRGPIAALDEGLGVSPRRWERDGWLKRSTANRLLALAYACGVPVTRLASRYHGPSMDKENPVS